MNYSRFLVNCSVCGAMTSKQFSRTHAGKCKACFTGIPRQSEETNRNARIIDSGWQAYSREEGHYDQGDY